MKREFWISKIEKSFSRFNILWLAGVRRVGKTTLCQSLDNVVYFDCELPRVRQLLEDPELFLEKHRGRRLVLDEIHRLKDPAELLKICADHYKDIQIIATGSSTLSAKKKFKDTLTNRKSNLFLTPINLRDMQTFQKLDIAHRFLFGGLPPFFLSSELPEKDYQDWMDDYWAKDVQELFKIEKRDAFLKFVELILIRSGGLFESTAFASPCEVSRQTISNYLEVLETTYVAHVIRPFFKNPENEIVAMPKVYGFDTGFVCAFKSWTQLRSDDNGILWEHFVLNELLSFFERRDIHYWREKKGKYEVDFVVHPKRGVAPVAIECKWSAKHFEIDSIKVFRKFHTRGSNFVVCYDVKETYTKSYDGILVSFVSVSSLVEELQKLKPDT